MANHLLVFNGIDAATGGYVTPPLTPREVVAIARGESIPPEHLAELKLKDRQRKKRVTRGLKTTADPKKLEETGWGVIFAHDADPAIREALRPLLDLRREQAARLNERRYREYTGVEAYRPGESSLDFFDRQRVSPGPADPDRMPYYLLLVGSPENIPFSFQYQLDVQYAVGRIQFEMPDEYAQYASSVVAVETGRVTVPATAAFFGVHNPGDQATKLTTKHLIQPLAESFTQSHRKWNVQTCLEEDATKSRLAQLLGGRETPALLFTASHGMGFPNDHPLQARHQGALLCQDWPGPEAWGRPIPPDFYFADDDVSKDAQLQGLIAFHFACYGAGTPRPDDFTYRMPFQSATPAARAFVAALPRRLLSHSKGGALAVIGHVDRAWSYSYMQGRGDSQVTVFENTLDRLAEGYPVGAAMEDFNQRYAQLATELNLRLGPVQPQSLDELLLADLWTANNDARSYIIVGDPAVRLPIAPPPRAIRRGLDLTPNIPN